MLYVLAVKEIGASRSAVIAGAAPLVAVTIALTILGEPFEVALVVGAMLIVLGVVALAGERDRPEHLRFIGLVLALASTVFFATRDNIVRWLSEDTHRRSAAGRHGDARQRIGGDGRVPPLPQRAARARGRASERSVRSPCPACSGACRTPPSSRPSTVDA